MGSIRVRKSDLLVQEGNKKGRFANRPYDMPGNRQPRAPSPLGNRRVRFALSYQQDIGRAIGLNFCKMLLSSTAILLTILLDYSLV
jgi:hypothetical protein